MIKSRIPAKMQVSETQTQTEILESRNNTNPEINVQPLKSETHVNERQQIKKFLLQEVEVKDSAHLINFDLNLNYNVDRSPVLET